MNLIPNRPISYYYAGESTLVPTQETMDLAHEVALICNTYWLKNKCVREDYEADLKFIGESLNEAAEENELCNKYDDFVEMVTANLIEPSIFHDAAKRTSNYVITATITIEAKDNHTARDLFFDKLSNYRNEGMQGLHIVATPEGMQQPNLIGG